MLGIVIKAGAAIERGQRGLLGIAHKADAACKPRTLVLTLYEANFSPIPRSHLLAFNQTARPIFFIFFFFFTHSPTSSIYPT